MPTLPRLKNSDNLSQWGSKINEGFQTLELVKAESISPVLPQNSGEFIVFWGQSDTNTNKAFGTHYNTDSPYQDLGDLTVSIPTNNQIVRQIKITDVGINYTTPPYVTVSNPYTGSTGFPGATGTTINSVVGSTGFAVNTIVSSAFAITGATGVSYKFYKATTAIAHNTSVPLHSNGLANNWLFIGRNTRLTVTVSGGNINGTSINDGGYGYSALPTVTITPTSGGTGAILTPVMYCDVIAGLTDESIENKPLITSLTDVTRATDYLLVYDSFSGATSFANSLKKIQISTITPDVPTGSVLFGSPTDSYIWDSANFHWDDTNNRLGVGTNTPTNKFTVLDSGTLNISGDTIDVGATVVGPNYAFGIAGNAANLNVHSNSTLGADVGATIGLGGRYTGTQFGQFAIIKGAKENATDGNGASYLAFGTRANGAAIAERMRITSAGNVGIGATSVTTGAKLDVSGTITFRGAGTDPGYYTALFMNDAVGPYTGYLAGYTLGFNTGGNNARSTRMYIDNVGLVGIGTSTPSQKLHIAGSGAAVLIDSTSGASANPELRLTAVARQFNVGVGGATFATTALQGAYYLYDATASEYRFVIDSSGRVGIGTTTPATESTNARLALVGTGGQVASTLATSNSNAVASFRGWSSTGYSLAIGSVETSGFPYIQGVNYNGGSVAANLILQGFGGNVGIGTASPDALLTVAGVGAFGDGSVSAPSISNTGDLNTGFWFPAADTIAASTAGFERFRVLSTGEIGIGITPTSKFHIATLSNDGISVTSTDGTTLRGVFYNSGGNSIGIGTTTNHPVGLFTNNTERIRITADGNVGIGTNSPDALLTVAGVGAFGDGSVSAPSISNTGDLNTGFWFPAADTIAASTAGVERIRVISDGSVGIGTTSPAAKLHVSLGGSAPSLVSAANTVAVFQNFATVNDLARFCILSGTAGQSIIQMGDSADDDIGSIVYDNSINAFSFRTNDVSNRMVIDSSGSVGIGTASPSHKLDVLGASAKIYAGGTTTDTTLYIGNSDVGRPGQGGFLTFHASAATPYLSINALSQDVANRNISLAPLGGNVGIGTTSPAAKLNIVEGSSDIKMGLNLTSNGGPSLVLASSANVYCDMMFNTVSTDQVRLRGSSYGLAIGGTNPRLNIGYADANYTTAALAVNGSVGIGTTSPGYKLDVVGDSNLASTYVYRINAISVLSANTLGSGVLASSLTSVGTITSGTWNGSVIVGLYGGTGVNNSGKTITLGGNLTTINAFDISLTASGTTSVTLPTFGTLVNTVGTGATGTWGINITGNAATITNQANSATITASTSTVGTIVLRDASGNFTAGTITASLSGNATTATNITQYTINQSVGTANSPTFAGLTVNSTIVASITGNAPTATRLAATRNITFAGNVSGVLATDFSGDTTVTISVNTATSATSAVSVIGPVLSGTAAHDLVYGTMADNDFFRIRVSGTGSNSGFVEFATADDGNEPIHFRQYSGVFTTITRTATILDASGNTSFPGTVTATSFSGSGASLTSIPNSATTANTAAIVNTIVSRDASNNFSAGTITASLSGNATTATTLQTSRTFSLTGNVTATAVGFNGSANVALTTVIGSGVVTDTMLAGSISNAKLSNSTITINGSAVSLGGSITVATVGGSNTQVQYNNAGALAGSPNMTFDGTRLTVTNISSNLTGNATTATTATNLANLTLPGSGTLVNTTGSGASGTWDINVTGNAATATNAVNLSTTRDTWATNGTISAVVGLLAWKNYGNSHVIFDASNATSPSGSAVNNTNAATAWIATYPTLMGWNGGSTFGVRVDSARISDSTTGNAGTITGQANSATITATSSNVGNQIVLRDGSGNFTAGTITASLSGNASTATNITQYTINQNVGTANSPTFAGLTVNSTIVANINGNAATITNQANSATITASTSTVGTIVLRDASGNFTAGTITATGGLTVASNVGIGTVSPAHKLDVLGNAKIYAGGTTTDTTLHIGNGDVASPGQGAFLAFNASAATPYFSINAISQGVANRHIALANIATNSYVGIGTASPLSKLHVSVVSNDGITVSDTTNTLKGVFYNTGGTSLGIGTTTNHPVALYTNNTERITITADGNVRIAGSSNPGVLSVLNTGSVQVTTLATARSLAVTSIQTLVSSGWLLTTFMSGSNPSMQVVDQAGTSAGNFNLMPFGGNVGIGTTDPQYKLDVAGNLRVTGAATFNSTVTATSFSGSGASLTSIPNSATTATNANTGSAIVARDGSGNFTAGTITASLSGNATTATTAAACSGNSATATTAAACSGNSATATTAAACSGNSATATTATNLSGFATPNQSLGTANSPTFAGLTVNSTISANINGSAYNITQYTINQSLGTANSPTFAGLTVNSTISANINGSSTSCSGNAATATTASSLTGFTIPNQSLSTTNSPNFSFLGINASANASYRLYVNGDVYATGDVYAGSDIRIKENISELSNALDKVKNLKGYSYNKIGVNHRSIGLMAQDVEKIIPEVVSRNKEGMKGIDYGQMIAMLVEAIKELNTKMETIYGTTV